MDVQGFLSDLYSELEQIEREIQVLGLFETGTDSPLRLGPGLSASELEPFRRDTAKATRRTDRMCWLQ